MKQNYNLDYQWSKAYSKKSDIAYPAEGVIRIFKGKFPNLDLSCLPKNAKVCDLGCGDGRHLLFLNSLGFDVHGVEISDLIINKLTESMNSYNSPCQLYVGRASEIPVEDGKFDCLITWNSCYYMDNNNIDFYSHLMEMSRVIRKGGYFICSIPKKDCFIFKDSIAHEINGYRVVKNDYFDMRDGQVMRCFENKEEFMNDLGKYFKDIIYADINMEWFGLSYRWHIAVAKKV